jgi:hypothetical protein
MKLYIRGFLALCVSSQALALSCPDGRPVGGHIGIPLKFTDLVEDSVESRPAIELLRVSIAWLPEFGRHRDQEVVRIDWPARTWSQVDLWDGELQGFREFGIREAELLDSTRFETGHLDIRFCMPADIERTRGLVFAFYGANGDVGHTFVAPFGYALIPEGYWFTAVIDERTTELVAETFNASIVGSVTEDVKSATGVPAPRFLAESLIQQHLQPATDLVTRDHAPFFNAVNARVTGNQVIVLDDQASVSVTHGVKAAWQGGEDILGSDFRIQALEDHIGPVVYEWHGTPRLAQVIDGRVTIEVSATACVDGSSRITGRFLHQSPLAPRWKILEFLPEPESGSREVLMASEMIDYQAACSSNFRLTASREPGGGQQTAHVRFTDPESFTTQFTYFFRSLEPLAPDWRLGGQPGPDTVRQVWNTEDLSSAVEISELGLSRETPLVSDDDGDGSVCNQGELELGGGNGGYIYRISLSVHPNLGHPDRLTDN